MVKTGTLMKRFIFLLVILFGIGCQSESNQGASTTSTNDSGTVVATATQNQPKASTTDPNAPVGSITLEAEKKTGSVGNEVCVGIMVSNFQKILSTQYTLKWDPTILNFAQVRGFNLPLMTTQNFGLVHKDKGLLPCVWIDNSLRGVNLTDGAKIYEICFIPKSGSLGKTSPIEFTETPTPFESVNLDERVLTIVPQSGSVTVQ